MPRQPRCFLMVSRARSTRENHIGWQFASSSSPPMIGHHLLLSDSQLTGCEGCQSTYLSSLSLNVLTESKYRCSWMYGRRRTLERTLTPSRLWHTDFSFWNSAWIRRHESRGSHEEPLRHPTTAGRSLSLHPAAPFDVSKNTDGARWLHRWHSSGSSDGRVSILVYVKLALNY